MLQVNSSCERLNVISSREGLTIVTDSERKFRCLISESFKFTEHGFKSLNARDIIYQMIIHGDYSYSIGPTALTFNMTIRNGKKEIQHSFECVEILPTEEEILKSINDPSIPSQFHSLFIMMMNKINNLEGQIVELNETVSELKYELEFEKSKQSEKEYADMMYPY